ncbi:MAG: hypothetical protein ACOZIN_04505, partial [Myxococcota bacterium]
MRPISRTFLSTLLLLFSGCNCGNVNPATDCTASPCGACPSECTANDQCLEGAWECACLCPGDTDGGEADGGTVLDGGG